jgi:hypothetical protein
MDYKAFLFFEANRVINEMNDKLINAYMKTHRKCYNHRQKAQSA